MLATFMLMAIIGLAVFRFFGRVSEPFTDSNAVSLAYRKGRVSEPFINEDNKEVTGILQGPAAKTAAAAYPFNDQNRIMEDRYAATVFTYLDNHDTLPAFSRSTETPGLTHPYTPYQDYNPEEDDARDIPWIASWSRADEQARTGQNCDVKGTMDLGDDITLVTVSKSCEAGMPHTRVGDRIIMPDSIPVADQGPIIEHERIHIYQHRKPEAWAKFYKIGWAFTLHKTPPTNMPISIRQTRRANPDTFETPWPCWKERYWPVPAYKDPENPQLRAADTVWWDETDRELLTSPPPGWSVFFGRPSQDEHPHELAAVMIVDEDTSSEAGRRLMDWWHGKKQIFLNHKGWM